MTGHEPCLTAYLAVAEAACLPALDIVRVCRDLKTLSGVSCEKPPGPDGTICREPHCFGWLKCSNGCVVNGYDWEGSPCVYDGECATLAACHLCLLLSILGSQLLSFT